MPSRSFIGFRFPPIGRDRAGIDKRSVGTALGGWGVGSDSMTSDIFAYSIGYGSSYPYTNDLCRLQRVTPSGPFVGSVAHLMLEGHDGNPIDLGGSSSQPP